MSAPQSGGTHFTPSRPPAPPPALVDHVIARHGLPHRSGLAYDYVLAGDGLFLAAENAQLALRVPVARCAVRGLPPIHATCVLAHGRLPAHLWHRAVRLARAMGAAGREVMLAVVHDGQTGYRLVVPDQEAESTSVRYRPAAGAVLELHSHHRLAARFSRTDDADEQGLCLYGVVGRLDRPRPHVALRAGAYGHFLPVPWETVFEGSAVDREGVHDVQFDAADPEDDAGAGGVEPRRPVSLWLARLNPGAIPRMLPTVLPDTGEATATGGADSAHSAQSVQEVPHDSDHDSPTDNDNGDQNDEPRRARADRWRLLPD